ncbi:MAG: threonine--tRNA ligase [Chloroflexi bacterium]|nr:threonine--tRNA ligase [Chloroflexota bacterium]
MSLPELAPARQQLNERDHRRIGRELDLFSQSDVVGPGLILWHPRGAAIRLAAEEFSRVEHLRRGYQWLFTPHIGRAELWQTSGHLDFYADAMYPPMTLDEGDTYYVKPMSCPFHIQVYRSRPRSYRELPIRYAEIANVYRYERSGVVQGLTRPRGFNQDDAHMFCRPDQVAAEVRQALEFAMFTLRTFGLEDIKVRLSTRSAKSVGDAADWDRAEAALREAIEASGLPFEVDAGGGAFYAPKIDVDATDALGRAWQLSTVQFDFILPERFALEYVGPDGRPERPVMIHRALFGSVERFLAVLIEHYAGAFPVWLAPVQAQLIPIADRNVPYLRQLHDQLIDKGLRPVLDERRETMQRRLAAAQAEHVPYMVLAGDRDEGAGTISVRLRDGRQLDPMAPAAFVRRLQADVRARR